MLVAGQTSAQVPSESTRADALEEVIVTARKRSESIQDVPGTVTSISAETLAEARITHLDDLMSKTTCLLYTSPSPRDS